MASSCRNAITAGRAAPERGGSWADFMGCASITSAWRYRDRAIYSRACRRAPRTCIELRPIASRTKRINRLAFACSAGSFGVVLRGKKEASFVEHHGLWNDEQFEAA